MKMRFRKEVRVNPLCVYFTAVRFEWKVEAQRAASCAAIRPMEEFYVPEMELASARVYHFLLKYCHDYRSQLAHLIDERIDPRDKHEIPDTRYEYLTQNAPGWWNVCLQNEGNTRHTMAFTAWVNRDVNMGCDIPHRAIRESDEFMAELRIALSTVSLIKIVARTIFNKNFLAQIKLDDQVFELGER
jgi:hypothetical protein